MLCGGWLEMVSDGMAIIDVGMMKCGHQNANECELCEAGKLVVLLCGKRVTLGPR
jgi:hypothetical protein